MEWNRTYGGAGAEGAYELIQTTDGGFALAGYTGSYGAGGSDAWLVKTDAHGNMEWQQTYGGAGTEVVWAMIQIADGGFALAGYTGPDTGPYGAGGASDAWLAKTDAHGNMEWQQTYGGAGTEEARAVIQTADGRFALAGYTESYEAGGSDTWLVKTDAHGNMEWQQTYGNAEFEAAMAMIQMADGGFALAGYTGSYGAGGSDAWLVKTDAHGNMEWQQTYGGAGTEEARAVIQTADGGFALAGYTGSYGVDGSDDAWLVKTDAHGNMEWQQAYGGVGSEMAMAMIQTADGGFALAGYTGPYGTGESDDAWLVKTDAHGVVEWNLTYGGSERDDFYDCIQTVDGGFALAGYTESYEAGGSDAWLVKTLSITMDTDDDGLYDLEEAITYGTDFRDPDTDNDGLSDGTEVTIRNTNPTIPNRAPTITVVSPNGGEYWGGAQMITWTAINSRSDPLTYTVYYSFDGGQIWTRLATGLTESSYLWDTTTIVNEVNCLIRVEATDGTYIGVDISNRPFEIANEATNTAPTVRVIRPNGGERVRSTFEVQWKANDPDGDMLTFTISYSPNEGQTWTRLANGVTETSYMWDTSVVQVGTTYMIKVEASDGVLKVEDRSDYKFTIEREAPTESRSEAFFVSSFRVVEALGALLVLLGLGKRRRRRKMLLDM